MTIPNLFGRAQELLRKMLGPEAEFREGQWQAIHSIVTDRGRVLVVQRTGWGKSLVYFLSTKLLREQGSGPTILVSPLLLESFTVHLRRLSDGVPRPRA